MRVGSLLPAPLAFWLGKILPGFIDFPCPACRRRVAAPGALNGFCAECLQTLPLISGRRCPGCGGVLDGAFERCAKCLDMPPRPWTDAVAVFAMTGTGAEIIYRFKYGGESVMARAIAELGAPLLAADANWRCDGVVPVPLYFWRLWSRGFNQAELLGGELARRLGVPLLDVMKRTRPTRRQATLSRELRLKNLRGAFTVNPRAEIAGRRLLLVDDVLTTGATLHAAAEALKKAGAAEIRIFVAARR